MSDTHARGMSSALTVTLVVLTRSAATAQDAGSGFDKPVRLEADAKVIDHGPAWGHCGPTVADVDGDGLPDLVVGDFRGRFRFYRNTGTRKAPKLADSGFIMAGDTAAEVPIN